MIPINTKSRLEETFPIDRIRDGFAFHMLGYRGKKAAQFKEANIKRFNQTEQLSRPLVATRRDFPLLTDNIKMLHGYPRPCPFSTEHNTINRLVTGMMAKQFQKARRIKKGMSIHPFCNIERTICWRCCKQWAFAYLCQSRNSAGGSI